MKDHEPSSFHSGWEQRLFNRWKNQKDDPKGIARKGFHVEGPLFSRKVYMDWKTEVPESQDCQKSMKGEAKVKYSIVETSPHRTGQNLPRTGSEAFRMLIREKP